MLVNNCKSLDIIAVNYREIQIIGVTVFSCNIVKELIDEFLINKIMSCCLKKTNFLNYKYWESNLVTLRFLFSLDNEMKAQ